jgi:hypothetical protein
MYNQMNADAEKKLLRRQYSQRYYNKKREEIVARMREKYNPEDAQAYYQENRARIRHNQNERYRKSIEESNKERLQTLLNVVEPALRPFLERLIPQANQLTSVELCGVEKCLLMAGRKSGVDGIIQLQSDD